MKHQLIRLKEVSEILNLTGIKERIVFDITNAGQLQIYELDGVFYWDKEEVLKCKERRDRRREKSLLYKIKQTNNDLDDLRKYINFANIIYLTTVLVISLSIMISSFICS